VDWKAEY